MTITETALRVDDYPTRRGHYIAPIPRIEPVVWGAVSDGPLNRAELIDYTSDGHITRHKAIPADRIPALRNEMTRIATELDPDDPRIIREADGTARSIFEPHMLSEVIADVARSDTILPVARQLLGGDVYIHQSRINFAPGFTSTGFFWHSDFETWHAEDGMPSMRAVTCVIALTTNYPHNGTLMVMPGSHRMFYPGVEATPADNHVSSLVAQSVGIPDHATLTAAAARGINQFTGPPGTALWFDCNTLHGSGSNITPFPRSNLFLVFNSVKNRLVEPFAAAQPRPEFLGAHS